MPIPEATSPPAITATALGRRLGRRWAVRDLDLTVPARTILVVAGQNGSGKTTLLRMLATALRPTAGSLLLFGEPPDARVQPRVGLVSHADYHYDALTALENLEIAAGMCPRSDVRPLDVLAEVGLAERARDAVATFSAGMRKRLALARLFWRRPALVLLDEPYAQLDPEGGRLIDGLFPRFRAEGTTVVVSTHQLARVAPFADEALVLGGGKAIFRGSAAAIPAHFASGGATGPEGEA